MGQRTRRPRLAALGAEREWRPGRARGLRGGVEEVGLRGEGQVSLRLSEAVRREAWREQPGQRHIHEAEQNLVCRIDGDGQHGVGMQRLARVEWRNTRACALRAWDSSVTSEVGVECKCAEASGYHGREGCPLVQRD